MQSEAITIGWRRSSSDDDAVPLAELLRSRFPSTPSLWQQNRSTLHLLSETFGRPFSLLWFLPTAVKYNGLTFRDMMPQECEV